MKIEIREMIEEEFENSIKTGEIDYIQGKAKAMNISYEEAKELSDKEYKEILPDGFFTKNHKFYTALVDNIYAGFAWVEIRETKTKVSAWGYDIHVEDKFRRMGVAKNIFNQLELKLKEFGVVEVKFHVYADNFKAIPLYEQFGFETTNIVMRKDL